MRYLCCALLFFCMLSASAQTGPGEFSEKPGEDEMQPAGLEDITTEADTAVDYRSLNHISDSSRYYRQQLDSIGRMAKTEIDSIQHAYAAVASKANSMQNKLLHEIDSLRGLNAPLENLISKLDSISHRLAIAEGEMQRKIESVRTRTLGKINAIEFPPEMGQEVSSVRSSLNRLVPDNVLNNSTASLDALRLKTGDIRGNGVQNLLQPQGVPGNGGIPALSAPADNITGQSGELIERIKPTGFADVTGNAGQLQGKVAEVSQLKSDAVDKLADGKISGLDEVKEIQQMSQIENADAIKSEDAMKTVLKKHVNTGAINHFSGKQEQLKLAMDKLTKYKSKYPSVSSIRDLKEKPRNQMKGRPLSERIVPGFNMQVQRKSGDVLVDFNPYVGYKLTARITAGAGWNQRLAYTWKAHSVNPPATIFGPRVYGEIMLGKGFSPRLETEVMNTLVPPSTLSQGDPRQRQWVLGVFTGLKKEYKFFGRVKGTTSLMVRLFDPKRQSPYADAINVRFGFEFPRKKHSKEEAQKTNQPR